MTDIVERLRAAFDGDDVVQKNLALRTAHDEIERLRGAIEADDTRLRDAGARVGIYAGCDTPEWLADEIERLRARVQELEADRARGWYDFCARENVARFAACSQSPHDFVQTIRAMGGEWAGREYEVEFYLSRSRAVELLAERERRNAQRA